MSRDHWTLYDREKLDVLSFMNDEHTNVEPVGTFEDDPEIHQHIEMGEMTYSICMISNRTKCCAGKVIEDFGGDTEYTREMICPYCGHEIQDAWELSGDDGEENETKCGTCGREFHYQRNIEITYSTSRKEN